MFIISKFKKDNVPTERCFVFGEDGRIQDKALVSTGAFFLDKDNKFAYDSVPESMGTLVIHDKKGKTTVNGQCAILYENSAQPYIFPKNEWADDCQSKTNILRDGRSEGIGIVEGEIESNAKWERWMPVLYVCLAILGLLTIIISITSGMFNNVGDLF